ncbi:hypothetical protein EIN_057650 [Entamoeba invadens IP1]|uniref:hypothetical protein n=1 Tax=Entamoeba invadens IP1 TaxID=370355 RepID=UPI0002C3ED44|nr:hypothetical protein EIN_057650 [Entamoeba invadens IP1]ELP93360.1 hypothetical protein EIN_057650 [Entamoeba invadens IP1]|eukprot:XP_004260131.1 hypothetical protein EIN_057650 [Entamoeba invadens IP1]
MQLVQLLVLILMIVQNLAFSLDGLDACKNAPLEDSSDFSFVTEMSWFGILLGVLIIFFSFVCLFPQIYKILRLRDGNGLSPSFLLILSFNQIFAVINATITNFPTVHSCFVIGFKLCLPQLLSFFQIVELLLLCYPIFFLFLVFYKDKKSKNFKRSLIYFVSACFFLIFSIGIIAGCLLIWGECDKITYYVGLSFGIGSTLTTLVEYFPQIWLTFRTKECGSMSFTTNWVTTVGTAVITFYMIFGTKQHFTTLMSYVMSLLQHIVLCFLQLKYDYIDKCSANKANKYVKTKINTMRSWVGLAPLPYEDFKELPRDEMKDGEKSVDSESKDKISPASLQEELVESKTESLHDDDSVLKYDDEIEL